MVKHSKKKSKNKHRKKYTLKKKNLGRGDNISNLGEVLKYNLTNFLTPKEIVKLTSTSKTLNKLRNEKQISKIIQSGKQKYIDDIINNILNNEENEYIEIDYSEIIDALIDVITNINSSISKFKDKVPVYDYKIDELRKTSKKITKLHNKLINNSKSNVKDVREKIIYMIEKYMFLDNLYQYTDKKFFYKEFYIIITDKDSKIEPLVYLFSNNKLENKLDI